MHPNPNPAPKRRVALFVTCLVNTMRPQVAFASLQLLEEAGYEVVVPESQTCCGQPAFNNGDTASTVVLARQFIETFESYDFVVAPSGSCAGMVKHFEEVLASDPSWAMRARHLAARTYELTSFLHDVARFAPVKRRHSARATYHDSCSGLRELGVKRQPRALLEGVEGLELREMPGSEVCCGFGGTFCVKYPAISNAVVEDKAAAIERTGADLLLGGDLGCLMNMAGKLSRKGASVRVLHIAEMLAGRADAPGIGEDR